MEPDARQRLADLLVAARREGRQIASLPPELVPDTPADGYAVNELVARSLGWPLLGWKIAGTTPLMQQRLRTGGEPIYGRTYTPFEATSPARLRHADLLDPLVECEFVFRLGAALPPRSASYHRDEVSEAIAACYAGVEVAECRFPLGALPPIAAILADGAASGRYIVGEKIDWRARDLAEMRVDLAVNGVVRRTGSGAEVMGHPLNALVWLANARSSWGDGLAEGALVSTGTATGMLLAHPGDHMVASFDGKPRVHISFDA